MSSKYVIRKAVRHALCVAAFATAVGQVPLAVAQDAEDEPLEEVIVTGTRIKNQNVVAASPVTV